MSYRFKCLIARRLLELMELTADQVLCVLKNLLGEEVLRDLLIRGISTVEIKDTEDILLIVR